MTGKLWFSKVNLMNSNNRLFDLLEKQAEGYFWHHVINVVIASVFLVYAGIWNPTLPWFAAGFTWLFLAAFNQIGELRCRVMANNINRKKDDNFTYYLNRMSDFDVSVLPEDIRELSTQIICGIHVPEWEEKVKELESVSLPEIPEPGQEPTTE